LFDETQRILTEATCAWAGIPLGAADVPRRARDFGRMVDAFGGVGPRLWKGKLARSRAERWLERVVRHVRRGAIRVPTDSALHVMAHHRDADGRPLDARLAAVELINVVRPTVAISWFITFAAGALHDHPHMRDRLAREPVGTDAGAYADQFMQEVRRFFPFTPFLGGRARRPFEWLGEPIAPGTLVLLDVYGMNHDPRLWDRPDAFRPERFRDWTGDAYTFIPQGGGDRRTSHRCAGEWIVMHDVTLALHFLARCMTWDLVPAQNRSWSLRRMPTRPRSGFVIHRVRRTPAFDDVVPTLPSRTAAIDAGAAARPIDAGGTAYARR
jgi:fatty-acid peroxygenase